MILCLKANISNEITRRCSHAILYIYTKIKDNGFFTNHMGARIRRYSTFLGILKFTITV